MYRLLIVDDEPIIVEGLYEIFQLRDDLPLEVYKAFDGDEALDIAQRARVDVLLTDIEMPGMNGLELQNAVNRLWPKCKSIFLTGYNDFHYIQSSMRSGALDYVLKREEDSRVIDSVRKAVQAIEQEHSLDRLLHDARRQRSQALPVLCREYVLELLQGERSTAETRAGRFAELDIPLRPDEWLYLGMGRIDEWREHIRPGDRSLFMYCIHNVLQEHYADAFILMFVMHAQDRFLWLMQPKRSGFDPDTASNRHTDANYILGTLESVQMACRTLLKLPCSFIAGCEPCSWDDISVNFDRLNFQFARGLGLGTEILLSDGHSFSEAMYEEHIKEKEFAFLSQALERKDRTAFFGKLDELSAAVAVRDADGIQSGSALTLFYMCSSMFIYYLNRHGLFEKMAGKANMNKLLSIQEHATWEEAAQFFHLIAEMVFDWAVMESGREISDVVSRVNDYIKDNIGGDLSLTRLSDLVHLTPSYLSRLYKQETGFSLSDYMMELKLLRAKEMLADTSKKIYQIGLELGFESAPYFNRLFKRMTNMTPQEYRDKWGGTGKA